MLYNFVKTKIVYLIKFAMKIEILFLHLHNIFQNLYLTKILENFKRKFSLNICNISVLLTTIKNNCTNK